jgi:hypothetical protein
VLSLLAVGFLRSRPKKVKAAWLENLIWTLAPGLLSRFSLEAAIISGDASNLEAKGDSRPQGIVTTFSTSLVQATDGETRPLILTTEILEPTYICLYKRKSSF